ncbi:MAG TPA: class II glutamine amidotransferase [Myxococcaceae bacterium]|jgi:glutamine amidotransferase
MCRLFGFRSNQPARVHRSLVAEKNSLLQQSREHKDGWGIAYYGARPAPEVAHGLGPAHADPDFERVSGLVSSHAVLAHVRLKSVGEVAVRNAHPFLHGRWAFAHNGTVRDFEKHREALERLIAPALMPRLQGETDSERCFLIFLTELDGRSGAGAVASALVRTMAAVSRVTDRADAEKPTSMNFMVTDGELLVASRCHRTLFFTEGRTGPHPAPAEGATVEQLVIASEELSTESHWHEVAEGELVGVDGGMAFHRWTR